MNQYDIVKNKEILYIRWQGIRRRPDFKKFCDDNDACFNEDLYIDELEYIGSKEKIIEAIRKIDAVMGVVDFKPVNLTPETETLISERDAARASGDFEKADGIRDRLIEMGVEVKDHKAGPVS